MRKFKVGDLVRVLYTSHTSKVIKIYYNDDKNDDEPIYEVLNLSMSWLNSLVYESGLETYKETYHKS